MVKAKIWKMMKVFDGVPKDDDVKLVEEDLPELKDEEILIEALYLTVDPYMRVMAEIIGKVGDVMVGEQVSKVLASKHKDFPEGTIVRSMSGWRSHTIITADKITRMPDLGDLPLSTTLGVMGMTGMTAYFGFLGFQTSECFQILRQLLSEPNSQSSIFVGCKVIGFAGDDKKCEWLKELGFDLVYNYKKVDYDKTLKEAAPDGIDCYFDNVGGEFAITVLKNMKQFGRMAICGQISQYNVTEKYKCESPLPVILYKQLKIEGLTVLKWYQQWSEGEKQMAAWIKEGKIKSKETVTEGFENMYSAFQGLFTGSNIGKAIVKC